MRCCAAGGQAGGQDLALVGGAYPWHPVHAPVDHVESLLTDPVVHLCLCQAGVAQLRECDETVVPSGDQPDAPVDVSHGDQANHGGTRLVI